MRAVSYSLLWVITAYLLAALVIGGVTWIVARLIRRRNF